jgi:hypothetical protein
MRSAARGAESLGAAAAAEQTAALLPSVMVRKRIPPSTCDEKYCEYGVLKRGGKERV